MRRTASPFEESHPPLEIRRPPPEVRLPFRKGDRSPLEGEGSVREGKPSPPGELRSPLEGKRSVQKGDRPFPPSHRRPSLRAARDLSGERRGGGVVPFRWTRLNIVITDSSRSQLKRNPVCGQEGRQARGGWAYFAPGGTKYAPFPACLQATEISRSAKDVAQNRDLVVSQGDDLLRTEGAYRKPIIPTD